MNRMRTEVERQLVAATIVLERSTSNTTGEWHHWVATPSGRCCASRVNDESLASVDT
jgi:hypothetical protein